MSPFRFYNRRAGRLTPGFLELLLSANVCMRVCVCASVLRLLITSDMIWTPYDKFYGFYMAAVVNIDV